MSETDVNALHDAAIAASLGLQRNLAAVKGRASALADEMEALAGGLRERPEAISVDSYTWLIPRQIMDIKSDIQLAEQELAVANDKVKNYGLAIPKLG
jgi:hypothetical protein